jgi:transcription antitermination factor NusG
LLDTLHTPISSAQILPCPLRSLQTSAEPKWHALWTRSHSEQLVHDQLVGLGVCSFLPKVEMWSRRGGVKHLIQVPMFPGYLFVHHALDKVAYLKVCAVRGLVRVLGERWDRLAEIPAEQVDAIQRLAAGAERVLPHPYLREGRRVRIVRGPLASVEGFLVEVKSNRGLLVVSIELLRRSVSVVVDCTDVEAA